MPMMYGGFHAMKDPHRYKAQTFYLQKNKIDLEQNNPIHKHVAVSLEH
jgi:hypothetical protein